MGCNYSALWQMQQAQKEGENGAEGEDVKQARLSEYNLSPRTAVACSQSTECARSLPA